MSKNFFKLFFIITISIIIFTVIIFIPLISNSSDIKSEYTTNKSFILSNDFSWPTPGFTRITSYFGYRKAPTTSASSYHSGIDIGAPEGSTIIAAFPGTVTLTEFKGAGGYTITIVNDNYSASYCHVSPDFIVHVGQSIYQGQIIGYVGPKNVYGIIGNPYKDKNGNPTNGATTGSHLHFTLKINNKAVNPLEHF